MVDFHLHTTYSDGADSPATVFDLCAQAGIKALAFTDHDRVDHLPGCMVLARQRGMQLVTGVEISAAMPSARQERQRVHILGYHFNPEHPALRELCQPILQARQQMSLTLIERLKNHGYHVDIDAIAALAKDSGIIYKQHIMAHLVASGQADAILGQTYQSLFKGTGILKGDIAYPDARDAIAAIRQAGGVAVLAHPGLYASWEFLPLLVEAGLGGIESSHPSLGSEQEQKMACAQAQYYGLLQSGGSDYHGAYGDEPVPGTFCIPQADARAMLDPDAPRLARARTLVVQLGRELAQQVQRDQDLEHKDGNRRDLVTAFDHQVEALLRQRLGADFPSSSFWGEENPPAANSPAPAELWIADPIDGTTNFVNLGHDYAISLGFYRHGQPRFGLVYDPVADTLYQGLTAIQKADGPNMAAQAWCNGREIAPLSGTTRCHDALIDISLNSLVQLEASGLGIANLSSLFRGHRCNGCASLALIRIALGELGAYYSVRLSVWDWAGARAFVEACGAIVYVHGRLPKAPEIASIRQPVLVCASELLAQDLANYFAQSDLCSPFTNTIIA